MKAGNKMKYSHLFSDPKPGQLAVGDGWLPTLYDFLDKCDKHSKKIQIAQIKEKFGQARIYADNTDEYLGNLIKETVHKLNNTCEVCGNPGQLSYKNWIRTVCKEHV